MAGNSVPAFFGSKGRTFKPVSLDVTFASDTSGSMLTYVSVLSRLSTIQGLELALRNQGVGIQQDNRYSVCTGAGGIDFPLGAHNTLAGIERFVIPPSGPSTRWAIGVDVRAGTVRWPQLTADAGNDTEDMALAAHLIAGGSRDYDALAERILISAGDLRCPYLEAVIDNSVAAATLANPTTRQRYVGLHPAAITITEPASADPVPTGTSVFGYVFTTAAEGVAIYYNNRGLTYRQAVDNRKVAVASTTTTTGGYAPSPGQADEIIAFAALTQGAIYDLGRIRRVEDTLLFAQSLGDVLGSYLYAASS